MIKGFDTAQSVQGKAHDLYDLGYRAVGVYLRSDRTSKAEIDGLHSVGIKIFSIWEKGNPTERKYFDAGQGTIDANAAVKYAKVLGQPSGTEIFYCVDYDASPSDIGGPITSYFAAVHKVTRDAGYLASVYGPGSVCSHIVQLGYCHSGFLAQSKGWSGFKEYKDKASIVQGVTTTVKGLSVDLDTIVVPSVIW